MRTCFITAIYSQSDKRLIFPHLARSFGGVPDLKDFREHMPVKRYLNTTVYKGCVLKVTKIEMY